MARERLWKASLYIGLPGLEVNASITGAKNCKELQEAQRVVRPLEL
jgi:hypothetical protein